MEQYFSKFRKGIIGQNQTIKTPLNEAINLVYADWTASGRMYLPIEERIRQKLLPFVANTSTYLSYIIGFMTGVINKFQRILGLKIHESFKESINISEEEKPIIFITHMEHHSNQTSWIETIGDVVVVPPDEKGLVSIENFQTTIEQYANRKIKIVAITSCSNVTGIMTPYMEIAQLIHKLNGSCFVDFACSAPYVSINMHPDDNSERYLDAVYFSPHKFLGGPGTTGILIFNKKLYLNTIPDNPGGGTVDWTNPWGEHKYVEDIEAREDGGTPAFLQTIKAAMCMQLKEEMGVGNIQKREGEILDIIWESLNDIPNLHILAEEHKERLGIISFYIDNLHYNLGVKMLNDRFGIQTRGGCSCAGTYGHYLLDVTHEYSQRITAQINIGNCSSKPGWIRLSIHPTHTNDEIKYMMEALKQLAENYQDWEDEYNIDYISGNIKHIETSSEVELENSINQCFTENFA